MKTKNIMISFFKMLSDNDINYVHFKSNVNLEYSFSGKGDFDVLIDPNKQNEIYKILISLNAKQVKTIIQKQYPGVDNWLFYDYNSGIIYHLHLHYKLMTGKAYLKEYEIPWREFFFETRIYDKTWEIYIADSNLELILLNVRAVVKSHNADIVKSYLGLYKVHKSIQQERDLLLNEVSADEVFSMLEKLFSDKYLDILKIIIMKSQVNSASFIRLSRIIRKELKLYRTINPICSNCISFFRKINYTCIRIIKRCGGFINTKKTSCTKGAIIAFVGVDGSGKSTTSKEIYKWMSKHFDCAQIYMGLGDGQTPLFVRIIKKIKTIFDNHKGDTNLNISVNSDRYVKKRPISFFEKPMFFIKKSALVSTIISIEKNNFKKMVNMNKYRIKGGISILDRYPQIEMTNRNDGPKIATFKEIIKADNYVKRMEEKEIKYLNLVKEVKPDIIFRLNISSDESMKRKLDQTDISIAQRKIEDLQSIHFQNARIIDIDATQPYEDELLLIKKYIWESI